MKNRLSDAELVKRALPLFSELVRRQLLEVCVPHEGFLSGNPPAPLITCCAVTGAGPNGSRIDLRICERFPIQEKREDSPTKKPCPVQ